MPNILNGYIAIKNNPESFTFNEGYFFKDNSIHANNPQFERDLSMFALKKADLIPCKAVKTDDGNYNCYRSDTGEFLANISEYYFFIFNYELIVSKSSEVYSGYFYAKTIHISDRAYRQTRQIYFIKTDKHDLTFDLVQFINNHVFTSTIYSNRI